MMRAIRFGLVLIVAGVLTGCAVHDGKEDQPAPIWWPAFLYREQPTGATTQPFIDSGGDASANAMSQRSTTAAELAAIE